MPGERNPQSAAEEFAQPPQGENVLDASMMAELIVTKKEIGPQRKKSAGTSRARLKSPGAGGQRLPLSGRHGAEHWIVWLRGSGALWVAGFAVSVRTLVEGKIRADTAAWIQVIQDPPQDRRHGKRRRSGHARLNTACRASVQPGGGYPARGYKPGGLLTEQTGRIVDTLRHGEGVVEQCYALENEQCDGRTSAVCV